MYYNIINLKEIPDVIFAHIYSCYDYGSNFKPAEGNLEIAYMKSGNIKIEISGKTIDVKEGSFIIFPHKYEFNLKSEENTDHIHYTISAMLSEESGLSDKIPENLKENVLCIPMCIEKNTETEKIFELLCEGIKEYQKGIGISKLKTGILFAQILCELSEMKLKNAETKKSEVLDMRIKKYIEKNISHKITLSDVSENIGKNPNYLNQVFKKINNMSIISYVNIRKMNKAAVLITDGHNTIKAAANAVGINDINYFSRLFKSKMGMTISEFKSNLIDNTYFMCDLDEVSK